MPSRVTLCVRVSTASRVLACSATRILMLVFGKSTLVESAAPVVGVPGAARKIESRAPKELGVEFKPYQQALKDSVDSMIANKLVAGAA